jgi:flagellar basal-body rod modification protein FlgD
MTVSPISIFTPTSSASGSGNAGTTATVNYDQFLSLLVAELQNQDPTAPTDPTQYMSQLASFSSVGQQIQTNTTLGTMLTSQQLSQAEHLIGQTITSADGTTTGTVASVSLTSAGVINATLTDGTAVTLTAGSQAGTNTTLADGNAFNLPVGVTVGTTPSSS